MSTYSWAIQLPSASDASTALAEGRAPEPVVGAGYDLAPDDIAPETLAAADEAPGRVAAEGARMVAFAQAIVSPADVDAIAAALAGPSPGADVEALAWAKVALVRDTTAMPEDNDWTCWLVCVATDPADCPANGLPP